MRYLAILWLVGSTASCVVTDVGNPVEQTQALEVSFSAADGRTTSDGTEVEQAWLWLGPMQWQGGVACDETVSSPAPGAAGWGLDESSSVVAPARPCALELTLEPAGTDRLAEAQHAELVNHSLFFTGITPAGDPFRVRTSQTLVFRAATPDLQLSENGTIRLEVDVDTLLDGLEWPEAEEGVAIRVDDAHETDLRDEIVARLEESLSLQATSGPSFDLVSQEEEEEDP